MSNAFQTLCDEVARDTKFLHELKDCHPHYQRVLDYIVAHPEERDEMAAALSHRFDIYPCLFLMPILKWPEVRAAAEARCNDGGNHFHDGDIKKLLEIYGMV